MIASRSAGSRARRQQKADAVRAQILAAGRTCFARRGLYETRVEEIAAQAGIAKGTFYLYFRDKEDLIRAVAQASFASLGEELRAAATARSWETRVREIAAVHLRFFAQQPDRMRILHQLRGMLTFDRPEWAPRRVCIDGHLDLLAELLFADPKPPGLGRRRAREVGGLLFGAVSGLTSVWASIEGDEGLRRLPVGVVEAIGALAVSMTGPTRRPRRAARRKAGRA